MEKNDMMIAALVILVLVAGLQMVQLYSMNSETAQVKSMMARSSGGATASSSTGFSSYEDMMAAHHGSGAGPVQGIGSC